MKILVFCPLAPKPPRLWGQTVQSIFRMEWDEPIEYLFRANDNPYADGSVRSNKHENVTHNFNFARRYMLGGGYDALLCIEADMIVPPDTIQRLTACDSDVAYGLYVFRHGKRDWSAYMELEKSRGRSLCEDPSRARELWGQVINVAGVGLGCTLIRRHVLERTDFHAHPEAYLVSCDWMLALDCQRYGYTQRCDTGLVCGHLSYKPFPMALWPDPTGQPKRMYRIEPLDGVVFKPLQVAPGEKVEIPVGFGKTELYKMPAEVQ